MYLLHRTLEDNSAHDAFNKHFSNWKKSPRTELVKDTDVADRCTTLVNTTLQPDWQNCGCFRFMHLRHRVLGVDVITTVGSGDDILLALTYDILMKGRAYEGLRSD